MHFKYLKIISRGFFFIMLFTFAGCDESGEGKINRQYNITTVDQLNDFIQAINFIVTLPDGKQVQFMPKQSLNTPAAPNYVEESEGFNFATPGNGFLVSSSGRATLTFHKLSKPFDFELVICSTIRDLDDRYSNVSFDPQLYGYEIFFAIELDEYSEQEVFQGDFINVHNALYVLTKNNSDFRGTFIHSGGTTLRLYSSSYLVSNGLDASGKAYFTNYSPYTSTLYFSEYSLTLTCGM